MLFRSQMEEEMKIYRIYVEKRDGFDLEARKLLHEINELLGISAVRDVRIINRYYVSDISEEVLGKAKNGVFAEPQVDVILDELPDFDATFAVEYVPGQFDQRADSCEQCIQFISGGERPKVKAAKVYLLYSDSSAGGILPADIAGIKKHLK